MPEPGYSPMYCERIEDIKADVEPFPFVPAMCRRFKRLKSSGYTFNVSKVIALTCNRCANLIPDPLSPIDHLSYSLLVHTPPGLAYAIHHCKVGLQRVEGGHGILVIVNNCAEKQ